MDLLRLRGLLECYRIIRVGGGRRIPFRFLIGVDLMRVAKIIIINLINNTFASFFSLFLNKKFYIVFYDLRKNLLLSDK